jgi:hypothetical protein
MRTASIAVLVLAAALSSAHAEGFTLVTTTDFSTGSTSSIDRATHTSTNDVEPISPDAVVRWFGDYVYVVNRGAAGNIQLLDWTDDSFNTVHQWSTGNGSNPHDIYVNDTGTVAYITRYDMNSVLKMDLTTGATLTTISLAAFADADGIPEMDQMFHQNQFLYVLVQRLDRNNFYSPTGASYVVKINMNTDTVVDFAPGIPGLQAIPLFHTNPYSEIVDALNGKLWLSAVGFFGVNDGGVIEISPADATQQTDILSETVAGGDILDVAKLSPTRAYAIVANASFETILIEFNPSNGTKTGATIYNPHDYVLSDLEIGTDLMLADRTPTNPGVRFFNMTNNTQILANPLDVGLPPFDILEELQACPTGGCGTAVGDAPAVAHLGQNYPNPFNPETSIPFTLANAGRVTMRVYDVNGHFVATLLDENRGAGEHVARWDGRDARGRASSSGIYFARLEANGTTETRKMVLLK